MARGLPASVENSTRVACVLIATVRLGLASVITSRYAVAAELSRVLAYIDGFIRIVENVRS